MMRLAVGRGPVSMSSGVLDDDGGAGSHGEFLGREPLPARHGAVDDPAVDVGLVVRVDDGLEVVMILEVRIEVP